MKINSNKGMFLENIINNSNKYYFLNNIAYIDKLETPIKICEINNQKVIGKFFKKSNVDYYGVYNKQFICFETKQTWENNFSLSNIKEHQKEYLTNIIKFGGQSWVIIFFNKERRFFRIDANILFNINKKSIDIDWCEKNSKELKLIFPGRLNFLD